MADETPEPLPKTTADVTEEHVETLRRIFPEGVTEDGGGFAVEFGRLREVRGDWWRGRSTRGA